MEQAKPYKNAVAWALSPIMSPPTKQGDVTVAATSDLLFASLTTAGKGVRRIRIVNTDSSKTLGVFLLRSTDIATGRSISDSTKIAPGAVFETEIADTVSVAAISSSGTLTANVLVYDLF